MENENKTEKKNRIKTLWKKENFDCSPPSYRHIFEWNGKKFQVSITEHPYSDSIGFNRDCCLMIMNADGKFDYLKDVNFFFPYKKGDPSIVDLRYRLKNRLDKCTAKTTEKEMIKYIKAVY